MKDSTLPPILKFTSSLLATAMGTTLMTKRTAAENVSESEMNKLVFEPFANPFRVYELYKDCEAFNILFESGAIGHCFNSSGYWNGSDSELAKIPLKLSHRLQTALLLDELEWEPWPYLEGAMIPTRESVDKIWDGYYDTYSVVNIKNREKYLETLKDRFKQRIDYIRENVSVEEIRNLLIDSLKLNI